MFAKIAQINLAVAFSGTNLLACLIQTIGGQNGLFATNAQINIAVAFSGTSALEFLLFFRFSWPKDVCLQKNKQICLAVAFSGSNVPECHFGRNKMVCLQVIHKSISLLLSSAQALWNAYFFPGLAGLRLFV